jgi:hypothetical protein
VSLFWRAPSISGFATLCLFIATFCLFEYMSQHSRRYPMNPRLAPLVLIPKPPVAPRGQKRPLSDPQALLYAAQSMVAISGGKQILDVTLSGKVTWTVGLESETGTVTLFALSTGESRVDLALSGGNRKEIRDSSTETDPGSWRNSTARTEFSSPHNCLTDPVWFFPALGSLSARPNVVLSYVGRETRNGLTVQHIRSYVYMPALSNLRSAIQQLSGMDFYLDSATHLPVATVFNTHRGSAADSNKAVEIDFRNYQQIDGVQVPMHIRRCVQGDVLADISLDTASFNTGLSLLTFAID